MRLVLIALLLGACYPFGGCVHEYVRQPPVVAEHTHLDQCELHFTIIQVTRGK